MVQVLTFQNPLSASHPKITTVMDWEVLNPSSRSQSPPLAQPQDFLPHLLLALKLKMMVHERKGTAIIFRFNIIQLSKYTVVVISDDGA